MKSIVIFFLVGLACFAIAAPAEEKYPDKFDKVDVEEILNNRRLFLPYVKCSLDQGKCSADAKELKGLIKEALETDCGKCTETQKKNNALVFKHLINNDKENWAQLIAKYDPENKYAPKYEKLYLEN